MFQTILTLCSIALLVLGGFLIYRDKNKQEEQGKGLFYSTTTDSTSQLAKTKKTIILEPKYPKIGKSLIYFSYLITSIIIISCVYLFFFKESCENIFGWNVNFLRSLFTFIIISIYVAFFLEDLWSFFRLKTNKDKYFPSTKKQPLLFKKECNLVDEVSVKEHQSKLIKAVVDIIIIFLIFLTCFKIIVESTSPIPKSNTFYQQKCLTELDKNKY